MVPKRLRDITVKRRSTTIANRSSRPLIPLPGFYVSPERLSKDLVTNATLQTLQGGVAQEVDPGVAKIHSGFKSAYASVNQTLAGLIHSTTDGHPEVGLCLCSYLHRCQASSHAHGSSRYPESTFRTAKACLQLGNLGLLGGDM